MPEDIQWDIINDSCISNKKEQTKPYIIDGDNIPFTDLPDDSLCLPDLPEDQVENFVGISQPFIFYLIFYISFLVWTKIN